MRHFFRWRPTAGQVMAVVIVLLLLTQQALRRRSPSTQLPEADVPHMVQRVVDGDTLLLEAGHRVRLLGVDTPETKHPSRPPERLGEEATAFTRDFLAGEPITLKFDRERIDDYGRVLAYVFVGERMLNEELIRAGLSRAELAFPYSQRMKCRFQAAEEEARAAGRGLWAASATGKQQ